VLVAVLPKLVEDGASLVLLATGIPRLRTTARGRDTLAEARPR